MINNKSPAIFGGPYLPYYNSPKPKWYKDLYGTFNGGKYPKTAGAAKDFYLSGGNFIVQRSILEILGGFSPELGMTGNQIGYAEEVMLQIQMRQQWPDKMIYFDPDLYVYHLVAPHKMKLSWRIKQQYYRGKSLAHLTENNPRGIDIFTFCFAFIKTINSIGLSILRGFHFRDIQKYPLNIHWLYEVTSLYFAHLGALIERYARGSTIGARIIHE